MGGAVDKLTKHTNERRKETHPPHDSKPDHPERMSLSEVTTNDDTEQKRQSLSAVSSTPCSNFYMACRNGEIDKVRKLLEKMTIDEIDQIEPNGSTALHAACFHGHIDIVKLLLEVGADRAIQNKYQCLPFDEAKNGQIKELFYRVPTANRFVSNTGAIEWELVDDDVLEKATEERQIIKSIYDTTDVEKMFEKIEKNYIDKELSNMNKIQNIRRFFQKATKEKNPLWIIKAYTAETDFYKVLNTEIACGAARYQSERRYIIALLSHHPMLNQLSFIGPSYRVIQMIYTDIEKYKVNYSLMTKSFLSSSIDRKIAELFLCQKESGQAQNPPPVRTRVDGSIIKSWVMCIYHIKHQRSALHIENSSQYVNEGEILIMPYTVFQVKSIKQIKISHLSNGQSMTEIELEECQKY
jgi:hypothetical protein